MNKILMVLFLLMMVCVSDVHAQNDIVDSPRETKIKADVKAKHGTVLKLMKLARGVHFEAFSSQPNIESLRGLKGIFVIIEPNIAKEWFSIYQIKKDVELQLKKEGIKVLTEIEKVKEPGKPYFYIYVNIKKDEIELNEYHIEARLVQIVSLERDNKILLHAPTWIIETTGFVGKDNIENSITIRDSIKDLMDKFINDYLSVNPK